MTQGSHAYSQDDGNNCISLTNKFKQCVCYRFYNTHTYFDLLNCRFMMLFMKLYNRNYKDAGTDVTQLSGCDNQAKQIEVVLGNFQK